MLDAREEEGERKCWNPLDPSYLRLIVVADAVLLGFATTLPRGVSPDGFGENPNVLFIAWGFSKVGSKWGWTWSTTHSKQISSRIALQAVSNLEAGWFFNTCNLCSKLSLFTNKYLSYQQRSWDSPRAWRPGEALRLGGERVQGHKASSEGFEWPQVLLLLRNSLFWINKNIEIHYFGIE